MIVELGDEHQFAHAVQRTVPVDVAEDAFDLLVGEESQALQLRAISSVDVDGVGVQVDEVLIEALHVCRILLALCLHKKLLHKVIP